MQTKICKVCGKEKPLSAFSKNAKCLLGVIPQCKWCCNLAKKPVCPAESLPGEIWMTIPSSQNYDASNKGRIRRGLEAFGKRGAVLKQFDNSGGYLTVQLRVNGKAKTSLVHRLVLCAFTETVDTELHVNHIDCNRKNNCVENLEWVTRLENAKHASLIGRQEKGESHRLAILTDEAVRQIRQLYGRIETRELARRFGVNNDVIVSAAHGRTWKHVNEPIAPKLKKARGNRNKSSKLTASEVLQIREIYEKQKTPKLHLARRFGVSDATIYAIIQRKIWTHI